MSQSFSRLARRRGLVLLGVGGIIAAAVGVLPAQAATTFVDAAFSGSANGSAVHVDALNSTDVRVVNGDISFGSSAVNSKGLTAQAVNENGRVTNPALGAAIKSYGYGLGIDVGLGAAPADPGQIQLAAVAENKAPPTAADVDQDLLGPLSIDPLAYAAAAHAHSHAKWNNDTCVLGSDIASGLGYTADAQLVDAGADTLDTLDQPILATDTPNRNVVQTFARNALVPNKDGNFGMQSRVEQTLAPVTIARGNIDLTIEVAGEWVLTATASGIAGDPTDAITYQPSEAPAANPSTPILRVFQGPTSDPDSLQGELTLQDLALPIPLIDIPGVAEITIGESPRAIGGAAGSNPAVAADRTSVSAAVDVVRVKLLDGQGGDIRIGHMEVKAAVPAGGITCPIPVTKQTILKNPPAAGVAPVVNSATSPGGLFGVSITIKNPFDCDLLNVSADDVITRKSGTVTFGIEVNDDRNSPKNGAGAKFTNISTTSAKAEYANLGTIPVGGSKVVIVWMHAAGNGEILDTATAKGTLSCPGGNAIGKTVALSGVGTLITTVKLSEVLARTGGSDIGLFAAIPAVAFLAGRRLRRSKRKPA